MVEYWTNLQFVVISHVIGYIYYSYIDWGSESCKMLISDTTMCQNSTHFIMYFNINFTPVIIIIRLDVLFEFFVFIKIVLKILHCQSFRF